MAINKKFKAIIFLFVVIGLIYGFVSLAYQNFVIVDVLNRPMVAGVTYGNDVVILNYVNITPLYIGKTHSNLRIKGFQIAHNNFSFPVKVDLETSGELAQFVTIEPTSFTLAPGETKKYTVSFLPTSWAEPRPYEGILKITKKRVLG